MIKNLPKITNLIIPVIFFVALLMMFGSKIIHDPDFWWHLKTGEYIFEHRGLPESDPFSYAPFLYSRTGVESFILNGYRLAQVLFYLSFKIYGFSAIYLLKSLVCTGIFLIQWLWMKREGLGSPLIYSVIAFSAYIILFEFPGERPQVFTFLFTILTIYLLENFKKTPICSYLILGCFFISDAELLSLRII